MTIWHLRLGIAILVGFSIALFAYSLFEDRGPPSSSHSEMPTTILVDGGKVFRPGPHSVTLCVPNPYDKTLEVSHISHSCPIKVRLERRIDVGESVTGEIRLNTDAIADDGPHIERIQLFTSQPAHSRMDCEVAFEIATPDVMPKRWFVNLADLPVEDGKQVFVHTLTSCTF
jgi:hypothetical protein